MSWKMVGEPKTHKLTKTLSEEYANMTPAPHDRPLNATRANVIRVAFETNKFRTCEWASAFCEETGLTYRINGKHTSTVLSSMNGVFPKGISIIIEKYHCDTLTDVADLYVTFDTRVSVRSTGDINRIYACVCPALVDISTRIVSAVVTGLAYSLWEESSIYHSPEELAQLIVYNEEFCLWVSNLLKGDSRKNSHLRRASVVAGMFKTWQKSKSAALEFWTAVRDATGTTPNLPDRKLEKFLTDSRIRTSAREGSGVRAGRRETYVKCLHAWNAWRTDQPTDLKYRYDCKTPAVK